MFRFSALFDLNKNERFAAPCNQVNLAGACFEPSCENAVTCQAQIKPDPCFRAPPSFLGTLSGFLRFFIDHIYFNDSPSA